jgi:hypothetical protein
MMMNYDYSRYEHILIEMLKASWRDPDELEIGVNISDLPEVKIIFDGYGDLDEENMDGEYKYIEGGNTNMESYAIFIHKDSLTEDFVFPEHDSYAFTFGSMIQHRPKEEVYLIAWYDVEQNYWEILALEDRLDEDNFMDENDVMKILEGLYDKHFKLAENPVDGTLKPIKWPFITE